MNSLNRLSKLAGIGYLIIFITGIFSNFVVLENMVVPGDAAATTANISGNESLFRFSILSFILMVIFDVILAWVLYLLFKSVNQNLSLLSGWLRLVNGVIFAVALYNLFSILQITGGNDSFLKAFTTEQLQAQVLIYLSAFNFTWLIGLVFFGLHLLVLGYLIFKSGFVPGFIGILLLIAGTGYLIDSFAQFLLANYSNFKDIFQMIVILPGVIGELSLTFWLLFKGIRD